jgi:hypothetical protein
MNRYSVLFAACLIAAGCTDEQAGGPAATGADTPAATSAPTAAPTPAFTPTLASWTGSLDGLNESPLCALDAVNGITAANGSFPVQANQPVTFEGWVSMTNLQNPGNLSIILDGPTTDFQIKAVTGVARVDVAKAYSSEALAAAGFSTALAEMAVPAGEYSVVLEHDEAGESVVCRTKTNLVVNQ